MGKNKAIFMVFLCILQTNDAFKVTRAIMATNANPMYLDFWPIVSRAWKQLIGVQPTLAFITDKDVPIDESLGDVIRFDPIPGVPSSYQSQVIRNFLPALFPDDFSILADIDMIPVNRDYLVGQVERFDANKFIVYRDAAYGKNPSGYPMCYNAAKGSTFGAVFGINSREDIVPRIKEWHAINPSWSADEQLMCQYLKHWNRSSHQLVLLHQNVSRRLDRGDWRPNYKALQKRTYIDIHSIRPYMQYKNQIDRVVRALGIH